MIEIFIAEGAAALYTSMWSSFAKSSASLSGGTSWMKFSRWK